MKKRTNFLTGLFLGILLTVVITVCVACGNKQFFDTTYTFDYAYIELPGGKIVEGRISSWDDYEGDQLQIKLEDGTTYLVHSSKCVMIQYKR